MISDEHDKKQFNRSQRKHITLKSHTGENKFDKISASCSKK